MEVISPTWDAKQFTYTFRFSMKLDDTTPLLKGAPIFTSPDIDLSGIELPVIDTHVLDTIVRQFVEQTKQWFTTPISAESMKKRLRQAAAATIKPEQEGWYEPVWRPFAMKVARSQFELQWMLLEWKACSPKISAEFLMESTTPRAHSPDLPSAQELRTIHIQDTLVPVGDLPLSDLPPLSFYAEPEGDHKRQEIRQKIREARLRVALAKLKAERMEHNYYERYGEHPADSEESSDLSSESDSGGEELLERQTYS